VMAWLKRLHFLQVRPLAGIPAVKAEVIETVDVTTETVPR